jgi:hypothetical protein
MYSTEVEMFAVVGIRKIIIVQLFLFILGALTHAGVMPFGYVHTQAMRAESIIFTILFIGFVSTFAQKPWSRKVVLGTQILAFLGTLVGLVMIIIGVGPRSIFDFALHAGMIISFLIGIYSLTTSRTGQ